MMAESRRATASTRGRAAASISTSANRSPKRGGRVALRPVAEKSKPSNANLRRAALPPRRERCRRVVALRRVLVDQGLVGLHDLLEARGLGRAVPRVDVRVTGAAPSRRYARLDLAVVATRPASVM